MNPAEAGRMTEDLVRPLYSTSLRYYLAVGAFGLVALSGLVAWGFQAWFGLGLSGLNWPVFWGFYLVNFVFWIGISHAGTLISAVLRLVNATWRGPVTRFAEAITSFSLIIAALFPLIHLGRPWLFFFLLPLPNDRGLWPNFRSPLVWDFFAISTYFMSSALFIFLPMIPDLALLRDRSTGFRRAVYSRASMGWQGTPAQWHRLESAMHIMAVAIVPVMLSVHTIVSFDFSVAPVPMWHTTIFGPFFVVGAILSGVAGVIIAMALIRKLLKLERYLLPIHFQNLGKLLVTMSLLWAYFVFNERLIVWYGNETHEMPVFWATLRGEFAPLFWLMVLFNFVIPLPLLGIRRLRTIAGTVIASCFIVVGMWLERFLIIIPSLSYQQLPYSWGSYSPRWPEIVVMCAAFGALVLFYLLFSKCVPIITIWELKIDDHPELKRSMAIRDCYPAEDFA
jgi:molybdopterin-containing oxidoreductase family membrane subunit